VPQRQSAAPQGLRPTTPPPEQVFRTEVPPRQQALAVTTPPPQEAATARRPYDIDIPAPPQRIPETATQTAQRPAGSPIEMAVSRPSEAQAPPQIPANPSTVTRSPGGPPARAYSGPRSGVVTWSGQIEKGGTVTLDGKLPGVPVMVDIDTREFAIVEGPSPANGWNRVVVRSKNKRHTVISLQWTVL
jgi:hypothetical protein